MCFTTIRAYRSVGSDLEPSTQPPLRGGKRIYSATVLSIDSVIESKIIFAHNGANSWIPETTVSPAPVRVSMHMLCISLHLSPSNPYNFVLEPRCTRTSDSDPD